MGMIWEILMAVFPFERVRSKLPPLSSEMAADVNLFLQTPTQLACQSVAQAAPQYSCA